MNLLRRLFHRPQTEATPEVAAAVAKLLRNDDAVEVKVVAPEKVGVELADRWVVVEVIGGFTRAGYQLKGSRDGGVGVCFRDGWVWVARPKLYKSTERLVRW